jgi:hypothetical protein
MITNNLILELIKVQLKNGIIAEKRYIMHANGEDQGKVFEDELFVNIRLDVSTFDKELIQEQIEELVNYKREFKKVGKHQILTGFIGSAEYNITDEVVIVSMLKENYNALISFEKANTKENL